MKIPFLESYVLQFSSGNSRSWVRSPLPWAPGRVKFKIRGGVPESWLFNPVTFSSNKNIKSRLHRNTSPKVEEEI